MKKGKKKIESHMVNAYKNKLEKGHLLGDM